MLAHVWGPWGALHPCSWPGSVGKHLHIPPGSLGSAVPRWDPAALVLLG